MHRSPVRKFAKASEGVGHRHKLPKLVEESNNLISLSIPIQGHGQARRMPVTRNAPFSLVFSAIRKENYQYVFRGKVRKNRRISNQESRVLCQTSDGSVFQMKDLRIMRPMRIVAAIMMPLRKNGKSALLSWKMNSKNSTTNGAIAMAI